MAIISVLFILQKWQMTYFMCWGNFFKIRLKKSFSSGKQSLSVSVTGIQGCKNVNTLIHKLVLHNPYISTISILYHRYYNINKYYGIPQ